MAATRGTFAFGRIVLDTRQVFFESPLSYATVNLKPLVEGHVLVLPKRFNLLNDDEVTDLWRSVHRVSRALEGHYKCDAFTFAIQDGKHAGQSVPHVHVHVLPRRIGDFTPNDAIYTALDVHNANPLQVEHDDLRPPRSVEEMQREADVLRSLFMQT
ncbi:hypothetical protein PBRA_004586 [Plasmodiophora brassicae]|uniref:Bis(5'-adenosyl)-triphosphatase n=1 Tax=Plasmodiophora brassicae TaxID=37360 RepID=A0A0G4IL24_PLABS|nr:hypothetical protein PBRA_004586 [Plasmodiophora brassicae]